VAESLDHLRLVELVIEHIHRVYRPTHAVVVFHDLPGQLGGEKPPRIGGFVPDIYAVDAPPSIVIVGEAKTEGDLETDHSRRQIVAFLEHVSQQRCGVFILAVPWQAFASAKNLVARLGRELGLHQVTAIVIDDVSG